MSTSNDLIFYTLVSILFALLFGYSFRKYRYWSSRGISGPWPIFPFGSTLHKALFRPSDLQLRWSRQYGHLYGHYTGLLPTLAVSDAALIKQICVARFSSLTNRRRMNSFHELWNGNLFMAEGDEWRRLRAIIGPAFSPSKLRTMFPLMRRCARRLIAHFDQNVISTSSRNDSTCIAKDVFANFTINVIAAAAFGTEIEANKMSGEKKLSNKDESDDDDDDDHISLVQNGKHFFELPVMKILAILVLPRPILNALRITQPFKSKYFDFFARFTSQIVAKRRRVPTERHDLIRLLFEASAKSHNCLNSKLTENEIISQCILFLLAGFETTAATLTHCIYELVRNPDVQERLYDELITACPEHDNLSDDDDDDEDDRNDDEMKRTTDSIISNVPYLEAVINETLRLYPPVVHIERRVDVDNFRLATTNLADIPLDRGTLIEISTCAVHYCENYFPDPTRFNPARFLPTQQSGNLDRVESRPRNPPIQPYTFIPFGVGPRNCVGARFAMQEMKICLAALVRRFRFTKPSVENFPNDKLDFRRGVPMLVAKPFSIRVERR